MSVDTSDILIGHGNLSIDGTDLGATEGGFRLRQEQEWFDAMVDQSLGVQVKKLVRRKIFGVTNVAEGSLANWAIGYGLATSALSGQTLTFDNTDRGAVTCTFTVPSANPAGFDRILTFARVVSLGSSETPFVRDGISFVPVEFEVLPSVDGGDSFGTVFDATS